MANRNEVYKCEICGNIVEVLHGGVGKPVCCGKPMKLMAENTTDGAKEKHVPVVGKVAGGIKVKVGSVAHPMEDKALHRVDRDYRGRKKLSPVSCAGSGARSGLPRRNNQYHGA